jgi:two-component system sensor histidine kinase/response regulator
MSKEIPSSSAPRDTSVPARILVVDDQPGNIQVVGGALGRLGHEIIPAPDGATALRRLALRPPDLILLDLIKPEMDGFEVCRRLREHPAGRDIPVIFLSAADDKENIVRALEAGGVDFITKPFNQSELISRVRTQLALKFARDRLRHLAEDKDELIGILAHDMKSHLSGMQMSAELLREMMARFPHPDARSVQLAENIAYNSTRLIGFVKEFLANAAADHGITVTPVPLSLTEASHFAIRHYQEAAHRKQLTIKCEIDCDPKVMADESALEQVLDNLLSNAVKFSPPGKTIFIEVQDLPTHGECRIRDQGPGFTAEDRQRMFQRYGRLSARPTGGEPSTGLGLSIVQKLVTAMNGELTFESALGEGATFTFRLPKAPHKGS